MKIASAEQMADIDKISMEKFGILGCILMENAGREVARAIAERWPKSKRVSVLCGPGNNGGDGYCVARTLQDLGYSVCCFSSTPEEKYGRDARLERRAWLLSSGIIKPLGDFEEFVNDGDLIVDALFGVGLKRDIEGEYAKVISIANSRAVNVVSVDVPSGVASDTGAILGTAIRCDLVVTIGLPKFCLFAEPGRSLVGEFTVAQIGFARSLLESENLNGELISEISSRNIWRPANPTAHKGSRGCGLIVGGSSLYYGAPILASEAVLRSGAGMCLWAAPRDLVEVRPWNFRELMVWPLPTENGFLGRVALEELLVGLGVKDDIVKKYIRPLPRIGSICLGPGLGQSAGSESLVEGLWKYARQPIVIDADALRILARMERTTRDYVTVLTPHRGEMASLLNCSVNEIENDLIAAARKASKIYGATVILKGVPTIICRGMKYWVSDVAEPVLAQAGTGDVLAGIITGLLAQGYNDVEAACLGVYIHSRAGRICAEIIGPQGVMAGDIVKSIPKVYREMARL